MGEPMNLLGHETSPYLLQHRDNPVHWRPWGEAALAEARESGKPILLSIGYAACHWCHVMAHESFENIETAKQMNALYVNVKVDREERPDIDHLYMSALHALGEQGGWPLTMFLTPDGDPFWGGTYFPPAPRWGKPGFRQVLEGVADAWRGQKDAVTKNTAALRGALAAMAAERPGALPDAAMLDAVAQRLMRGVDPVQGGMRGAPKFPNPPIFHFIWQNSFRSGDMFERESVHNLLERMSQGGIYDHLGGGFARYSTDAEWLAPHFEKMLYDNAQILDLLSLAHAERPRGLYAERAAETVGWMLRDMTAERVEGRAAFAASEDADSEGEEGRFYVWTEAEIDALLGADAPVFKRAYDVTAGGNWEGHTILRRVEAESDEALLARCRSVLFHAREGRVRPGRDDKVLADWNGLAVAALCRAGAVFGQPEWIARAGEAFDFVMAEMGAADGRVQHAWRLGRIAAPGMLDDQAAMALGAVALFEATGDAARLEAAQRLVAAADAWFLEPGGSSYFTTAHDARDVPFGAAGRPRTAADNATPAGNGMMALALARLWHLTGEMRYRAGAEGVLTAFGGMGEALAAAPTLMAAADLLERGIVVVVVGDGEALVQAALRAADPAVCVLRAVDGVVPVLHPAFGKMAKDGVAAAYVCRGGVCGLPVREVGALRLA